MWIQAWFRISSADERDRCFALAIGVTSNSIEAPRNPPGSIRSSDPGVRRNKNFNRKQQNLQKWNFLLFFICKIFTVLIFLSLFTLWLQNLHSVINSGLCLLSTYIRRWNPPSYADPTFRSRNRCTCPVNDKKREELVGALGDYARKILRKLGASEAFQGMKTSVVSDVKSEHFRFSPILAISKAIDIANECAKWQTSLMNRPWFVCGFF